MPAIHRRALLGALLAAPAILPAGRAGAEGYRSKRPIRLVVPFTPGATSDTAARIVARALQAQLDRPIVVENRPGAGGGVGSLAVAQAAPDGLTLLNATSATLSIVPRLTSIGYEPLRDLVPVAFEGEAWSVLAVHPSVEANSVEELLALARRQPGVLNYASSGIGSFGHVIGALLFQQGGAEAVHVPYPGAAPAVNSVVAGDTQVIFDAASMPLVQAGRLRGLAVLGSTRWDAVPALPTLAELGLAEGWPAPLWYGLAAPARVPADIIAELNAAVAVAHDDPEVAAAFHRIGLRPAKYEPELLATRLAQDWENMGRLLASLRLTA